MEVATRFRRGLSNPAFIGRKINVAYHRRLGLRSYNTAGVDVFAEDWDNLLVLDACRYDTFATRARSRFDGSFEGRTSRGSSTLEWLRGNFADRRLHDVVYVTANPQLYRHRESIPVDLHATVDIWREEGWHREYGTVLPETTTDAARRAAAKYPNKRLVVHYMQPHYPFVGAETEFDKGQLEDPDDPDAFWRQIMSSQLKVPVETILEAYRENLDRVLPAVEDLLADLNGPTVITADHGNMVGERSSPVPIREWGHPAGVYTPQLVEVPWLEIDGDARQIVAEPPTTGVEDVDDDVVEDRLRDLGYV